MPNTLRLSDGSYMRHLDVKRVISYLLEMKCVEVLGFSNIGKSALMRLLAQPDVWTQEIGEISREFLPVYIDCNRMLEMTDQGFYELVLRCLQESGQEVAALPGLQAAYQTLVQPQNEIQVPLSFSKGLRAVLDGTQRKLILLLDEFDEPFANIESRVFLNLRAEKDRNPDCLAYVTATNRPLTTGRTGLHSSEFCELFAHQRWQLAPLTLPDVERYARQRAEDQGLTLTPSDVHFLYQWTGGHPSMMEGLLRLLLHGLGETSENPGPTPDPDAKDAQDRWTLHRRLTEEMRDNDTLQRECTKILQGFTEAENDALLSLYRLDNRGAVIPQAQIEAHLLGRLAEHHILLSVEGKLRPFSRLLAETIQRQGSAERGVATQLRVDLESGAVLVNGVAVETLTALEYKLMLLLNENEDKIVDKYQIVTAVWGEEYLDAVDDARIEKLISRLRQKVEPNTSDPRFITTVRGRGYRLLINPEN